MLKQRDKSYTFIFENVRAMAAMLSPPEFEWFTELPEGEKNLPFILHLSCMAHITPHIAYIAQKILEKLDIQCPIVGGPENCCGGYHYLFGEKKFAKKTAVITLQSWRKARPTTVLSICPTCDERFAEYKPESLNFLHGNVAALFVEFLDRLKPLMRPVNKRVVLHYHDYNDARKRDENNIRTIMAAIPSLEVVESQYSRGEGKDCNPRNMMSPERCRLLCEDATDRGAQYLIMPYHSCYRRNCMLQISSGLEVRHYLELLAMALDIKYTEPFKQLRLTDDLDEAVEILRPKWTALGFSRESVAAFMQHSVFS